jgi:hypothetical protein
VNYAQWFDIAQTTRLNLHNRQFFDGVERAAALAALEQQQHGCGQEAQLSVIQDVFRRYEFRPSRWDGSIA